MSTSPNPCRSCGTPVTAGARFCGACGAVQTGGGAVNSGSFGPVADSGQWEHYESSSDSLLDQLRVVTRGVYDVSHCLGRGGMAAVYLARDVRLKRRVAIKVMLSELRLIPTMPERFRVEAQTAAALSHPNIIVIHSVDQVGDLMYFVMSYVDGLPLDEILKQTGPMQISIAQALLAQVATALDYAHSEGVTHRDVKPGNIMVNSKGDAIVTDFGIAKVAAGTQLTQSGATIGTAAYMSPEQCVGRDITGASDQYSLGIVAFMMLTGRLPFLGSAFEVQMQQVQATPPDPRSFRADLSPELSQAILRMLSKQPQDRFPRLEDAAQALLASGERTDPGARARLAELARSGSVLRSGLQPATPPSPIPNLRAANVATPPSTPPEAQSPRVATPAPTPPPPPPPPGPVRPGITAARTVLEIGESIALSVALPAGRLDSALLQWSVSDPTVLFVALDGQLSGVGAGASSVKVTYLGESSTVDFSVVPASVKVVRTEPNALTMREGEQNVVRAAAFDGRGQPHPAPVTWRSSDESVVTVSTAGEVTAVVGGRAQLVAAADGVEATIAIEVSPAAVAEVQLAPTESTVLAGATIRFAAHAFRDDGAPMPQRRIQWSVDDRRLAEIDQNGRLTARAVGRTTVVAECEGVKAKARLEVRAVPVERLTLSPESVLLGPGKRMRLSATVTGSGEVVLSDRTVLWRSRDERIATVSAKGEVKGVIVGTTTIEARCEGASASASIDVSLAATSGSFLGESSRSRVLAGAGGLVALVVVILAGWRVLRTETPPLANVGETEIAAESVAVEPGSLVTRPESAIVTLPTISRIVVDRTSARLEAGRSVRLRASAVDSRGRTIEETSIEWRSLSPDVATVSPSGVALGVSPGRANIEARAGALVTVVRLEVQRGADSATTVATSVVQPVAPAVSPTVIDRGVTTGSGTANPPLSKVSETRDTITRPVVQPPTVTREPERRVVDSARSTVPTPTERDLRELVDEFAGQVSGRRASAVSALMTPATDAGWLKDFLRIVEKAPSLSASVTSVGIAASGGTTAHFTLSVGYRTVGGSERSNDAPFTARLAPNGTRWRLQEVKLTKACC